MKLARCLLIGLIVGGAGGHAAGAAERAPDYANLEFLVGRWTTAGSERDFVETCDWYPGRLHVVCHAERRRPDGSTAHGMSILSFVPGEGYVYTGIGSNGRYETLRGGTWSQGVLTFTSTAEEGGKEVVTRIQVGPATAETLPFLVDTSSDGVTWTRVETTTYVRLAAADGALASAAPAAPKAQVDHVILGIDDLDRGVAAFEELTGVEPIYGGRHPRGTHNALVALGEGLYLEILAPQPGVELTGDVAALAGLRSLTPVGWAVSSPDVAELRGALSAAGLASTPVRQSSRATPSGATLAWHAFGLENRFEEAPFFIVWSADSPHPSTTSPAGCRLRRWQVAGPGFRAVEQLSSALGLSVETAEASEPAFRLSLACPKGVVDFPTAADQP